MKYSYKQSGLGASLRQLALAAGLVAGVGTAAQAQALNYPLANTQNVAGTCPSDPVRISLCGLQPTRSTPTSAKISSG